MKYSLEGKTVGIIGLGYVGMPLVEPFSNTLKVIGFDVSDDKIKSIQRMYDNEALTLTTNPKELSKADFIIICVPTPVTKSKEPDLSDIISAAEVIGQNMKPGVIIVLESTVYPGVMEELVKPILEKESALKCGQDFKIAYSPERINPGDDEHPVNRIAKVVAGMDEETTEIVAELYRKVTPYVFKAKDIKTAEAAKVIENCQRDLNIALVNELAIIFEKMGLNIRDVLDAAATKWNFHKYSPGLVGGHCIPVDPYYLVFKAKELGYHPQVILSGRAINDYMPKHVAQMTIKALNNAGKVIKSSKVLIMGLTYKENVADIRETPVKEIIQELKEYGVEITGYDPMLNVDEFKDEFGVELIKNLDELKMFKFDCIVICVAHSAFSNLSLSDLKQMQKKDPILIDVRGMFDAEQAKSNGILYMSL